MFDIAVGQLIGQIHQIFHRIRTVVFEEIKVHGIAAIVMGESIG
jgi:hypothetical protein